MVAASPIINTEYASANACDGVGEPLGTYVARQILEDPYLQDLKALGPRLQPPSLEGLRPKDWTVATWKARWPTEFPYGEEMLPQRAFVDARWKALKWAFERACYRIVIVFLDAWGQGDLELWGCGADGAWVLVSPTLRNSNFMALHVLENRLVPAHWRGQAPPAVVQGHIYSELEVRPVQAVSLPDVSPPGGLPEPPSPTPKRKSNGRDYRDLDARLCPEMQDLIKEGKATSPEDAAREMVSKIAGSGTEDSRIKRLALRYREWLQS
jgi:hypothetical protein